MRAPISVQIVSDVICPWCLIGYKQLEQSHAEFLTRIELNVEWQPFQLNPDLPLDGESMVERNARNYGSPLTNLALQKQAITSLGRRFGIRFDYFDEMRVYPTYRAHQLLYWSREHRKQTQLEIALLEAYFTQRMNPSAIDELVQIATSVGLPWNEARLVIEEGRYTEEVEELENIWRQRGIRSVPTFLFDKTIILSGAPGVEAFSQALEDSISGL